MQAALAGDAQWPSGGQNLDNWRNQSDTRIGPHNVGKLKIKWEFTTGGDVSATPAVVDGVVYFPDFAGNFFAVNAKTGALVWERKISDWTGIPGDWSRNDPLVDDGKIIIGNQAGANWSWNGTRLVGAGARVMAVDAATGDKIWLTQPDDSPTAIETASPVAHDGVVYVGLASAEEDITGAQGNPCCVSRGSLVALSMKTGKKLWQTFPVPSNDGRTNGYSGGAIWDTPVIDPKRNSIYVGTGNNYSVPPAVEACNKANPTNTACTAPNDYFDSVLALDLRTGAIKWSHRALAYDTWNVGCIVPPPKGVASPCPTPKGPDYDFGGSGPNLLLKGKREILGIGEKSGIYWAFDPDDGKLIWHTQVGPGATLGGIEWGTATDGKRIYVPIANSLSVPYTLQPSGSPVDGGSWAALDPENGKILWQVGAPGKCSTETPDFAQGCLGLGPASTANGVVFVGSMDFNPKDPTFFALDAKTGKTLWSFVTGSSVNAAPAIVGDSIYWGSGYDNFGPPYLGSNKFFAFSLEDH